MSGDSFRNGVETIMAGILDVVVDSDVEQAMHALAVVLTSLSSEVEDGHQYLADMMLNLIGKEV